VSFTTVLRSMLMRSHCIGATKTNYSTVHFVCKNWTAGRVASSHTYSVCLLGDHHYSRSRHTCIVRMDLCWFCMIVQACKRSDGFTGFRARASLLRGFICHMWPGPTGCGYRQMISTRHVCKASPCLLNEEARAN
jgi:hypothetical protein